MMRARTIAYVPGCDARPGIRAEIKGEEAMDSRTSIPKVDPRAILKVTSRTSALDGIVARATARSWPFDSLAEEMLGWASRSTAAGLSNAARYLQRAANGLDRASFHLARPARNGSHLQAWPFDLMGLDDEIIAPHLA
jgi:hypothetical protein